MGETPNDIERQMNGTRTDIENTLGAIKMSAASTADRIGTNVASTVNDAGNRAGDLGVSLASGIPKLENPMPFMLAAAVAGFAAGFLAPLTDFERKRLGPVGEDLVSRLRTARAELVGQSRAIVDETIAAAKTSATKHGKEAAENLGV